MKTSLAKRISILLICFAFMFMAYSYQTGTSRDLWIAYIVTGIPIAVAVVIGLLVLFLVVLRFATKRKIAKNFRGLGFEVLN